MPRYKKENYYKKPEVVSPEELEAKVNALDSESDDFLEDIININRGINNALNFKFDERVRQHYRDIKLDLRSIVREYIDTVREEIELEYDNYDHKDFDKLDKLEEFIRLVPVSLLDDDGNRKAYIDEIRHHLRIDYLHESWSEDDYGEESGDETILL